MSKVNQEIVTAKIFAVAAIMLKDSEVNGWSLYKGLREHLDEWHRSDEDKDLVDCNILSAAVQITKETTVEFIFKHIAAGAKGAKSPSEYLRLANQRCDQLRRRFSETGSFLRSKGE